MEYPETVDVLVVGAGPSGLTMAYELVRRGINCRIIDKLPNQCKESRALGIHARTLELFERIGILRDFLSAGIKVHGIDVSKDLLESIMTISTESIKSSYPFMLVLPQHKTETILIEKLKRLGVTVERNLELVGLKQEHIVLATLKNKKGITENINAKYVIGCDGAHSICRSLTGINFEGKPYNSHWLLADAKIKSDISFTETAHIALADKGLIAIIPLSKNHVRFILNYNTDLEQEELNGKLSQRFFQQLINERSSVKIKLEKMTWMSAFNISHHIAETMFMKNVFLVGDAAHIHSPAGAQGMNTGIQDANSLAWKLALVLNNKAHKTLLESYSERQKIIRGVVDLSHYMTLAASVKNPILKFIRNLLLKQLNKSESWKVALINRISQVNSNYRHSNIVGENWHGPKTELQPGDFFPRITIINGKSSHSLGTLIDERKHCLLLFGQNDQIHEIAKRIEQNLSQFVDVVKIGGHSKYSLSEEDMIKLGITDTGIYLIRPDGYIGYRSAPAKLKDLEHYLHKIFI